MYQATPNRGWGWRVSGADEFPSVGSQAAALAYAKARNAGMTHDEAWAAMMKALPGTQYR